jgi:hypothetical protein
MNNKFILSFIFLVVLAAVSLVLFNTQTLQSTTVPDTTTTTVPDTTTTTVPDTTTTTVPDTTTTTVPDTTTTTVPDTISDDSESVRIVEEKDDQQLLYIGPYLEFPGFEGSNQEALDLLVSNLPSVLIEVIGNKVLFINGCHQYALSLVSRCPYGVWDSSGTNPDGTKGAKWSLSIWISNRAFTAEESQDVLIHESAHAFSYLTRNCSNAENTSYRKDAWNYFGGEEEFADALVLYFGGSYNHYRLAGELTKAEIVYLTQFIDTCSTS